MAIYEHTTKDGYSYEVYVPDNYSSNSPIISYNFSQSTSDPHNSHVFKKIRDAIETQGYDNIVIFPNHLPSNTYTKQYQDAALNVVADVKERYGLTSDKIITTGFSSSCTLSFKTTAEYIKKNPGVSRQITFANDGFIWKDGLGLLNREEVETLVKNDTLIVEYCQDVNKTKLSYDVINNLDMLIVTDKPEYACPSSNYWVRHSAIPVNFFESEIYHEVLDFLDGKANLSTSRYNFYTNSGGKIIPVTDPNDFYDLLGLDNYSFRSSKLASLKDYKVTSSNPAIQNYIGNIMRCIGSSAFLNANFSYSGSSTTSTPSAIPQAVSKYFNSISNILSKIADLASDISNVHDSYIKTDGNLSDIINNQNNKE